MRSVEDRRRALVVAEQRGFREHHPLLGRDELAALHAQGRFVPLAENAPQKGMEARMVVG